MPMNVASHVPAGRFLALAILAVLGLSATVSAHAAIYYVDALIGNDSAAGSQVAPKKTIAGGLKMLSSSGGDVVQINAGTYAESVSSVTAGKSGAYNVVRATVDGTVVIKGALDLGTGDHFLQFEGLKWDDQSTKVILGRYLKFLRCAFKGGPSSGNVVTVQIGSNDNTPGAQFVLLEDSWVYGLGGRYKVLVYNSDKIVLRRVVVRHDGGWTYDGNNPEAGIALYDSTNVEMQNSMVVDSLTGLPGWESNVYLVSNSTTSQRAANVNVRGSIVLGGGGNGMAWDGASAYLSSLLEDVVVWGPTAGGIATNGSANKGTVNRATVKSGGAAFADWKSAGGVNITNSIAYQNSGNACESISATTSVAFGNGGNNCGTTLDPTKNGLKFLPRIESGSPLATMGSGGGQIGAQIVNKMGVSGTLWGDTGYNTLQSDSLWPWPYESRIKADMSEVNSRGFTTSTLSLTDYLWAQLGTASPIAKGAVPNPPTDVSVQ